MKFMLLFFIIHSLNDITSITEKKEIYYYIDSSPNYIKSPHRSIIQLEKGKIYIIDYPPNQGGILAYSIGKYKTNKKHKSIKYTIKKNIFISLNTGTVTRYSVNCNQAGILNIDTLNTLTRVIPTKNIKSQPKLALKVFDEEKVLLYKKTNDQDLSFNFNWVHRYSSFDNKEKLIDCSFWN